MTDEVTSCGIKHWYKSEFEKLGWMILAHARGHKDKTDNYIKCIEDLHKAINNKLTHIVDPDCKHDFEIMSKNVECLCKHAKKDFGEVPVTAAAVIVGGKRRSRKSRKSRK